MELLLNCFKILSLTFVLASPPAWAKDQKEPTPPPVNFRKAKITLGGKILEVEVAENNEQRARGLMFRDKLGTDQGMLFIFESEQPLSFWMKNTFLDLAIGFFDKNRTLVDSQEMQKSNSVMDQNLPSYSSSQPAKYALEMNKNWFEKNKVKLGSRFEFVELPKSRSKSSSSGTTK